VFAFPHSGGSGRSSFSSWLPLWPAEIELCAVELPGRPGRRLGDQPFRDYESLAEALVPELEPLCDLPFAIFGASLGAAMAFEVTRRLGRKGLVPRHFYVAACAVPTFGVPHRATFHPLPDAAFVREVETAYGGGLSRLAPEVLAALLPGLRADFEMIETGRPPAEPIRFGCPVTAYAGADDPVLPVAAIEEWASWTDREFQFRAFARGHFFLPEEREALIADIEAGLAGPGGADGDHIDSRAMDP
jgi:surfactin synthase thioesterase subunit